MALDAGFFLVSALAMVKTLEIVAGVVLGIAGAGLRIYMMRRETVGNDTPVKREKWTANFWSQEFASRGREFAPGNREKYRELAGILQRIRDHVARPILVNCGERKPDHNAAVGGALNSRHLPPQDRPGGESGGVAADFHVPGFNAAETYRLWLWIRDNAGQLGVGGTDFYPKGNFIHIDTRPGPLATWGNDSGRLAWEKTA